MKRILLYIAFLLPGFLSAQTFVAPSLGKTIWKGLGTAGYVMRFKTSGSTTVTDTILTKVRDSVNGETAMSTPYNNWSAHGSTGLTSAPQKYTTNVNSGVTVTVGGVTFNDITGNGSTYGNGNTTGFPSQVYQSIMFSSGSSGATTMTLRYDHVPTGTINMDYIISTGVATQSTYPMVISAPGATSVTVSDAKNDKTHVYRLTNPTVTGGTFTVTITSGSGSGFAFFNMSRMEITH